MIVENKYPIPGKPGYFFLKGRCKKTGKKMSVVRKSTGK